MPRAKGSPHKAQLKGQSFNWLFVKQRFAGSTWECLCQCGKQIYVTTYQLKSGKTKSCGCYSKARSTKHGMEKSIEYTTWAQMLSRCKNPNNKAFLHYGGRGIKVCDRWHNFINFFADMGSKPIGLSLDRIDNDGDYTPQNCQWVTTQKQIRNRRVSPKFEWQGQTKSLAELSEQYNLPWRRVYERIRSGWSLEKALLTKIASTGPKK